VLQKIENENKNWLEKLKRADPKPDYLVNTINYITNYNVGLEELKRVNLPKLVGKWRDKK